MVSEIRKDGLKIKKLLFEKRDKFRFKKGEIIQTTPFYEREFGERKFGVVLNVFVMMPNLTTNNNIGDWQIIEFIYNGEIDTLSLKDPHLREGYYVEKVNLNDNLYQDVVQALRDGTLLGVDVNDVIGLENVQCRMEMM